jgi:tripeptide aminopeptidase
MDFKSKIKRQELIDDFINMAKIDSPSFQEGKMIEFVKSFLLERGFEVKILPFLKTANIYAYRKGKLEGSFIMGAHMDVVNPCIGVNPVVKDDIITCDGKTVLGGDNKLALAVIFNVIKILDEYKIPHASIELAITSAEEVGVLGARYFDINLLKSKKGIILDAGGRFGKIVTKAPTHDIYTLNIKGVSSHAGISPELGDNAILKASKIIPLLPTGRLTENTVANIGKISGGKATNIVPDDVKITGELRSHDNDVLEKYKNYILNTLEKNLDKKDYEIIFEREYSSFELEKNSPFIKRIAKEIEKTGITPEFLATGGGSDANAFNQKGFEIVNISCGMMKPHALDEYIHIDDLIKGTQVLLNIYSAPAF